MEKLGVLINSITIVFNNLYSKMHDLYTLAKIGESREKIKFAATKVVDILVRN